MTHDTTRLPVLVVAIAVAMVGSSVAVAAGPAVVAASSAGATAGPGGAVDAVAADGGHRGPDATLDRPGTQERAKRQDGGPRGTVSDCAATPSDNFSDPEEDALGWENGTWYNETIEVDQSDGLTREELRAAVDRTMARVEAIRCLEFESTVPVTVISRQDYVERQRNESERRISPTLREFDNAKFEALFLINESADSIAVQNRNRGAGVLGFFDPEADEIFVISENGSQLRLDELTLAHEVTHALQDQTFNISADPFDARTRDQANANNGVVEGAASYVEYLYEQSCTGGEWNGTCLLPSANRTAGELANIGVYFVSFQPYSDGPPFIANFYRQGGWDAVNQLYENPPASTEQVIHPEKYGNDTPTNVTIEESADEQWSRIEPEDRPDYGSVGESALMSMFVYPLYHSQGMARIVPPESWLNTTDEGEVSDFDPLNYSSPYSAGWDGDRLFAYRNVENESAYVWKLAWDSPEDAEEFYRGYRQVLRYWGAEEVAPDTYVIAEGGFADAFHVEVSGDTVTIVNAPTREQLSTVHASAGDAGGNATAEANQTTGNETAGNETAGNETTGNGSAGGAATLR